MGQLHHGAVHQVVAVHDQCETLRRHVGQDLAREDTMEVVRVGLSHCQLHTQGKTGEQVVQALLIW